MERKTLEKKKYMIDLAVIFFTTLVILICFWMVMHLMGSSGGSSVNGADGNDVSGGVLLMQTAVGALTEFGVMGLGVTIVCILRKESFRSFGFKRERIFWAAGLSLLVYLPTILYKLFTSGIHSYFPFVTVSFTKPILASGFPVNIIGLLMIMAAWGFFEGFTYVVIADRINKLIPSRQFLLNWGAVICGIACLLLHTVIGLPPKTIIAALCDFSVIYGMLLVRDATGNAWGTVFIYTFLWNAMI